VMMMVGTFFLFLIFLYVCFLCFDNMLTCFHPYTMLCHLGFLWEKSTSRCCWEITYLPNCEMSCLCQHLSGLSLLLGDLLFPFALESQKNLLMLIFHTWLLKKQLFWYQNLVDLVGFFMLVWILLVAFCA
jgi:hypothetical protein